jgi:hypothetical protein
MTTSQLPFQFVRFAVVFVFAASFALLYVAA